jgi:hypothetical protein
MPALHGSGPVPGVVAYALVNEDGASPDMNSGVETSRSAAGTYLIDLPTNLAQPIGRDVVVLTLRVDAGGSESANVIRYRWNSTTQIQVEATDGGAEPTGEDTAFDFVLLRSTLTPVVDEPA